MQLSQFLTCAILNKILWLKNSLKTQFKDEKLHDVMLMNFTLIFFTQKRKLKIEEFFFSFTSSLRILIPSVWRMKKHSKEEKKAEKIYFHNFDSLNDALLEQALDCNFIVMDLVGS